MSDEMIFFTANALIAPVWLAMIVLPRWKVTQAVVRSLLVPGLVAAIYFALVLTNMGKSQGGFFTLDQVVLLFSQRRIVLTGWVHYLCVDLVVGSLVFCDGQRLKVPHLALAPCLFLTLMWGPIGVLAYLVVRRFRTREWKVIV
jgi:hypothetical protein